MGARVTERQASPPRPPLLATSTLAAALPSSFPLLPPPPFSCCRCLFATTTTAAVRRGLLLRYLLLTCFLASQNNIRPPGGRERDVSCRVSSQSSGPHCRARPWCVDVTLFATTRCRNCCVNGQPDKVPGVGDKVRED